MEKIYAPIDNKNLMEDPFEDDVFRDFYAAPEHRKGKRRHLIGHVKTENYDAFVDVKWNYGDASIDIQVIAIQSSENYELVRDEVFVHYEKVFKEWECKENENLRVGFNRVLGILNVSFWWEVD